MLPSSGGVGCEVVPVIACCVLAGKRKPGAGGCKRGGDIGTVGDGEDVLSGNLSHLSLVKRNLPLGFLFFFGLQIACTFSKQGTNIIILNALSLALVIGITRYGGIKEGKGLYYQIEIYLSPNAFIIHILASIYVYITIVAFESNTNFVLEAPVHLSKSPAERTTYCW